MAFFSFDEKKIKSSQEEEKKKLIYKLDECRDSRVIHMQNLLFDLVAVNTSKMLNIRHTFLCFIQRTKSTSNFQSIFLRI